MDELELIKKYEKKRNTALVIIFSIAILILIVPISILWKIFGLIVEVFFMILYFIAYSNLVDKILNEELNPQKFYTVTHGLDIAVKDGLEDVMVAYYLGDYGNSIGIAENQLEKIKSKNIQKEMRFYLALNYFEIGDFEKLEKLIPEIKSAVKDYKNNNLMKIKHLAFVEYFENFMLGNFEKCKEIEFLTGNLIKEVRTKSLECTIKFYFGLAAYYCGEIDIAKENFLYCVEQCNNFNYSIISKKYISAIDNNKVCEYNDMKAPSTEYVPQQRPQKQKMSKKDLAKSTICGLVIVGAIIWANVENIKATPVEAIQDYVEIEETLVSVPIDEKNSIYVYNEYNLGIGFAIVEEKNKNRYICHITNYFYLGSEWEDTEWEDISQYQFGFDLANIDKSVTYKITENKSDIPAGAVNSQFVFDDGTSKTTYYIYITEIEDFNTWAYHAW